MKRKKLIIIGGGFAGINACKALKKANLNITLLDKKNHHLFQPLLYQAATATLSPRDISVSLREIFAKQKNTTVLMGEVIKIDKEKKEITLENGDILEFDYLIVAIGARHSYFGNEQWEQYAPGIKTLKDALLIRNHILTAFERAEREHFASRRQRFLNFVIVGAGPTGVEFAGTIAELLKTTFKRDFRHIDPRKANIYLIEGADRPLPPFPKKLSKYTKKTLEKMGVKILTKTFVTEINEFGVMMGEKFIESNNIIWAAGNTVSNMLDSLDTKRDRAGRVVVCGDLSIPNSRDIFVLGDAASFTTTKGQNLPGVATVAIQQGRYVGKLIKQEIKRPKRKRKLFKFFDKGSLATIGSGKAVASAFGLNFKGLVAWFVWGFVHVAYLIGFRNRLSVMFEWALHHLTGARAARIIHGSYGDDLPKNETDK
ncbi:MAG: NADH dehydrogenase-like protein [Chlamydiia bacterium]|nr:NADH dehydrogenase-like protein [Chlamydiia bacterium]